MAAPDTDDQPADMVVSDAPVDRILAEDVDDLVVYQETESAAIFCASDAHCARPSLAAGAYLFLRLGADDQSGPRRMRRAARLVAGRQL